MRLVPLLALALLAAYGTAAQPSTPGPRSDGETVRVTADDGGFRVQSADQRFDLRIRGDLQADSRFALADAEQLEVDQFYLRRARLTLQGTLGGRFDFKLMPNLGQGRVEIQDAYIDARFSPAVAVQAGKFKVPFGLEWQRSANDIAFAEFGLPSNLAPRYDVGLMVHGGVASGRLGYELGVFDGALDGQNADGDVSDGKDVAVRLFAQPFRGRAGSPLEGLGVGVAATVGDESGTMAAPGVPAYRTSGGRHVARYRAGTADTTTVLAEGTRVRYSPQAYLFAGPVAVLTEFVASRQTVRLRDARAELTTRAYQAAVSWLITGEKAAFGRVRPARPFGLDGGLGAFEVAARYHALRVDDDAFPVFANPAASARDARAFTVGLNWYPSANLKVMADYERTTFRLADAAPASTPPFPSQDLILTRIQVAF